MKTAKSEEEKWAEIGRIIKEVQEIKHHHHTLGEYVSDATVKPLTGVPLAIIIIFISFYIVRHIGEGLIGYVFDPLFDTAVAQSCRLFPSYRVLSAVELIFNPIVPVSESILTKFPSMTQLSPPTSIPYP